MLHEVVPQCLCCFFSSVDPRLQQGVDFRRQIRHLNATVRLVRVVRVQTYQIQVRHFFVVLALQNAFVHVQLNAIVPEIGIGQMRNARRQRRGVPKRLEINALAPLPIVNLQRAVGVLKDHVNRP